LNTTTLRLPHVQHGHAGDRRARVFRRGGVDGVVRADDEHDVGLGEVVVDLVEFEHDVVRHLGFGEQHVHVARQAPGDGMDAEAHLDAALAQPLREVGDRVLRLRDGHAVARRDDHGRRIAQECGDSRGIRLVDLAVSSSPAAAPRCRSRPRSPRGTTGSSPCT
jgi:hypothetical protein